MLCMQKIVNLDTCYAMWYVTESIEQLLEDSNLSIRERKELNKIRSNNNKRCWLAARKILRMLLKVRGYACHELVKKNGKYQLAAPGANVCISYNFPYAVACVDRSRSIGIDIRIFNEKLKKDKYLCRSEQLIIPIITKEWLYTIISTKMAASKAYANDDIPTNNIKENIYVDHRPKRLACNIYGRVGKNLFIANFFTTEDYVITWCRRLLRK